VRVSDFVLVKTFTSDFTKFCSLISVNFILFDVVSYPGELTLFDAAFDILGNPWFITGVGFNGTGCNKILRRSDEPIGGKMTEL
jgi:hypothetical protein